MLSKKQIRSVRFKTLVSSVIVVASVILIFINLSDIFRISITRKLFSFENIFFLVGYFFIGTSTEEYWFRYIQNQQLKEYDKGTFLWKIRKEQRQIFYFLVVTSILAVLTIPFTPLVFWLIYPLLLLALLPYYLFCFFRTNELNRLQG